MSWFCKYSCAVVCVCSIISVMSASYYSEVNLDGFVKLFNFRSTRKCTLHLTLDGAYRCATKCGYKCEDTIEIINDNLESSNKSFYSVITCSVSATSCKWLGIQ
jgi:hypothetical protein